MTYKCFDLVTLTRWGRQIAGQIRGVLYTSPAIYEVWDGKEMHKTTADNIRLVAANDA